jgi:hypothetical protein
MHATETIMRYLLRRKDVGIVVYKVARFFCFIPCTIWSPKNMKQQWKPLHQLPRQPDRNQPAAAKAGGLQVSSLAW